VRREKRAGGTHAVFGLIEVLLGLAALLPRCVVEEPGQLFFERVRLGEQRLPLLELLHIPLQGPLLLLQPGHALLLHGHRLLQVRDVSLGGHQLLVLHKQLLLP
jgi:hypothetical protein